MEQDQNIESSPQKLTSDMNKQSINRGQGLDTWLKFSLTVIFVVSTLLIIAGLQYEGPPKQEVIASQQSQKFENRAENLAEDAPKEDRYKNYLRVARAEYILKKYDKAIEWLNKFSEEDKNYQGVWYTYAQVYHAQGNNTKALESVKKAVIATPDNPQSWILYFELTADLPHAEQDLIYKEALIKTENDPDIVAAYQTWQAAPQ